MSAKSARDLHLRGHLWDWLPLRLWHACFCLSSVNCVIVNPLQNNCARMDHKTMVHADPRLRGSKGNEEIFLSLRSRILRPETFVWTLPCGASRRLLFGNGSVKFKSRSTCPELHHYAAQPITVSRVRGMPAGRCFSKVASTGNPCRCRQRIWTSSCRRRAGNSKARHTAAREIALAVGVPPSCRRRAI